MLISQIWMRPNGRNGKQLSQKVWRAAGENAQYVEFLIHSSELMPGGGPYFPKRTDIEALYRDLDRLFYTAVQWFSGCTLKTFREKYKE